jgi:uncharacterized protein involved in exopolysaccharide biosynthesis
MKAPSSWLPETPFSTWDDFWFAIRASKLIILAVFLATVAGAYLGLQTQDDQFESEARILVKLGRENMDPPVTVEKGIVASTGVRKEEILTNVLILSSQPLIEQTMDEIGVDTFRPPPPEPKTSLERLKRRFKDAAKDAKEGLENTLIALNLEKRLTFREKLLLGLQKSLTVERDKESDVILVKLKLPSPEIAQRFLEILIRRYRDAHIEVRRDGTSTGFFQEKTNNYLARVNRNEDQRAKVRADFGLSSVDEERRRLLARQHDLYGEIESDQRDLALLPAVKDDGKTLDRGDLSASNASTQIMKDRIAQQRIRRIELLSQFQPGSDEVRNTDAEIAAVELIYARTLQRRILIKQQQAATIEKRLAGLNSAERQLEDLERERQLAVQNYTEYSKRLEDARISEELDRRRVANISILSPPSLPVSPIFPRRLLIMILSLVAGLVLGLAVAVLLQGLSDRITRPRDLAGIEGLEVLGAFDLKRLRNS